MSASTKRKNRLAEIEAGTYRKQTVQKEREEKQAKEKRTILICACVAAVIVLAAILLNVIPAIRAKQAERPYTEGVAVTIGDRSYSPAEVSYLYSNQAIQLYNQVSMYQQYGLSLYDIDLTNGIQGIGSQPYTDTQPEGKNYTTWRDFLLDSVYTERSQIQNLLRYARENGIELTKEETQKVEETIKQLKQSAAEYGFSSAETFLSLNYGTGITLDTVRTLEQENALASKAYTAYQESLSFSAEELAEEYDASLSDSYDLFTYAYYTVKPEVAEGEEVTDEAKAEAEAEADAILMSYQDGYDIEDHYERFNGYIEEMHGESAEIKEEVKGSSLGSIYGDWLKEADRQPGDAAKFDNGDDWIAVLFLGRENGADYNTVNVRHILVKTTQSEDGTWTEEAQAEAKAEAERILAEWEAGDKTEESFAALAEQYSSDDGSNTNGGLYENVYRGQMVSEFNDFCFAEGRKAGDVGIVHGNNGSYDGYHVIYFAGEGELYRDTLAKSSLTSKALSDFLAQEITVTAGPDEALVAPISAAAQTAEEAKTEG